MKFKLVLLAGLLSLSSSYLYANEGGWSLANLKNMMGKKTVQNNSKQVIVYLKNGNAMNCELVHEDAEKIVVNWEGGDLALSRSEIAKIDKGYSSKKGDGIILASAEEKASEWNYKNNPVARLTSGQTLDAAIASVKGETVVFKQDLGDGAYAEQDIEKKNIEAFEFRPVFNNKSREIKEQLKKEFPKMKFHELGMVTLITDSEGAALKNLKQTIRDQQIVLYLEFFELLKDKQPEVQHFVVSFDKLQDYFEQATLDGVPAWLCPGYFIPDKKVLYCMNFAGEEMTDNVYQVVQASRAVVGAQANAIKSAVGNSRDHQVDGIEREINSKIENALAYLSGIYAEIGIVVLRHEFTHEFLHDWGLQTILVSKLKNKDDKVIKKKKEIFSAKDEESKKDLLTQILEMQRSNDKESQVDAANSWFVEGLAEYAATTAHGEPNNLRIYELKEARRKSELWPIEHLTVYKMGSFPGVTESATLSAYAQSWSFVSFLMKNYRIEFMSYLGRMAKEKASNDDDLKWLAEALHKDLKVIEKEWHAFIDALPDAEDPLIEQMVRLREILNR